MVLSGKKVVLTGGTRGIGELVTRELERNGADILLIARGKPQSSAIRHAHGDLSTMSGVAAICETIAQESPDILVNLAGAQYFGPIEQQKAEDVHASYMVNLVAPDILSFLL
jgi:NAD(P)-dependent dehydrogenase (short-subunit alcohol dehydrogenase family)